MNYDLVEKPTLLDYQEVIAVFNTVFSAFPDFKEYSPKIAFEIMEKSINPTVIKVYDASNTLVGFSMCYERYPSYYHFWELGVLEECRGAGIATKIYEVVEAYAKDKGYKGVSLNTFNCFKSNIRLLIKRGYIIYELDKTGAFEKNPKLMFRLNF